MIKCAIDDLSLKLIKNMTARVLRNFLKEHEPIATLKSNMKDLFKTISELYELSQVRTIAEVINNTASRYGILEQVPDFLNIDSITNLITAIDLNVQINDSLEASSDLIFDVLLVRTRLEANREFLDKAYGLAKDVLIYALNLANLNIFDCCFINRGSVTTRVGITRNTSELNSNIREYLNMLLRKIITYLKGIVRESPNLRIDDTVKRALRLPSMYDLDNKYTGILETLKPLLNMYLTDIKSDLLMQLFNDMNNTTIDQTLRLKSLLRLDAYNAYVLLLNFDTYLTLTLGKVIQIKDFNQKTGLDKYQISDKTAKLATTWRVSENIDVEAEADAITKLAINTTPIIKWQSSVPMNGKFLHFSDFLHTVAKIKDLTYLPISSSIVFNLEFIRDNNELWNLLSTNTRNFLKDRSLSSAINYIRRNPRKYTHLIFEILTNLDFSYTFPELYKGFTKDELDKLYSISLGIFTGNNSLYRLTGGDFTTDYYSFITLTVDSIFNVRYIQYYRDLDGVILVRTLIDQGINNIRRGIELTINTSNSGKLIKNWDEYKKSLKITPTYVGDRLQSISFVLPNTDTTITVLANSCDVRITSRENILNYAKLYTDNLPFIDLILKLNLLNNTNFLLALIELFGDLTNMSRNLLLFASRVVFNQYVLNEFLKNKSLSEKEELLDVLYGRNAPRYNHVLDELGLVHGNDIRTLNTIAVAKANVLGLTISSLVKDGEGHGLSLQTLSRLLGSLLSLFEMQERSKDSVTSDFILLNIPGLFEGVYTTKEFNDQSEGSKSSTDMNVSEMAYSQIVYDFVGGLMLREEPYTVGNNHILLLPSVNSDKSTIGRIKINLNTVVSITNPNTGQIISKPLKDYKPQELEWLISRELGTMYSKMYNKIVKDWSILDEVIQLIFPDAPKLSSDFVNGFQNFNSWFFLNQTRLLPYGKNASEFIKYFTLEYNKTHRLNPLTFIDLVHYKNNKGSLGINKSIIALIARFNPLHAIFKDNPELLQLYPTASEFWIAKKAEVLKTLLKNDFKINTTNSNLLELQFIRDNYKGWINNSGDLILAKVNINGLIINISSARDLLRLGYENTNDIINSVAPTLLLNPILEQYNYLDYLLTLEFMDSTVGSFIAHPEKSKSNNILYLEAAHFLAQHKRNVSFTAAMHAFLLNLLNGIPEYYNLAVIDDITDQLGTIIGIDSDIKPFDGATFVNPFVVILENNSLGGARAGITKKQFVHFKNESTGTGGIIKTAGFGLTNDWIRNSPFLEKMMRKMTNHIWLNEDGSLATVDITRDYRGSKIVYKDLYFKENGKYYKITNIQSLGNNLYRRLIEEVNIYGTPIGSEISQDVLVNTNYLLWNLFGGKNSMIIKNNTLELSNTSVENVVIAMNNTASLDAFGNPIIKDNALLTLDDLWQPLKHVDVHYLATAGAVKLGAANINSASKYTDEISYDTLRIRMYLAGILLDKEHHADNSELSLMTLVISACAAKGYTIDLATNLYRALRTSTDIKSKDHLNAVKNLFTDGSEQSVELFLEVMMKSLIKALSTQNSDSFAKSISIDLIKLAKEGKNIKFSEVLLPLSDNTVYSKVFSTVSSYLTNSGIKLAIPGILSVLTPSYDIFKLYAGRKYESFTNPQQELAEIQALLVPVYDVNDTNSNISNLELGRTYIVTREYTEDILDDNGNITSVTRVSELPQLIRTPNEYKKLKEEISQGIVTKVVEDVTAGRNLAGYNVRFNTNKGRFQIWDLDSASALFELNDLSEQWEKVPNNILVLSEIYSKYTGVVPIITPENAESALKALTIRMRRMLLNDLMNLSKTTPNVITLFRQLVELRENTREWYNKFALWVNIKLGRSDGSAIRLKGLLITVDENNFSDVFSQVILLLAHTLQVRINGEYHNIDKSSIITLAYEIIMPKVFATAFGLSEFDDLNVIQNDRDFFIKQYLRNLETKVLPNQYTLEFKSSKGSHIYLLNSKFVRNSGLRKLENVLTINEDGSTYRTDSEGNIMYQISPDSEIYVDELGNEVIVSDDNEFYINNLTYDSIKLSNLLINFPSVVNSIIDSLKTSSNKMARLFCSYITSIGTTTLLVLASNNEYHSVTLDNYTQLPETNPIIRAGRAKHTSFLRSLDIVAARIPAQSQLSYMPMKVVAYDNPDINTAYVSTYLILLQGSDYDVDAVSLATFDIDENGLLLLWSPYANLLSEDFRVASEELPFPSGIEGHIYETDNVLEVIDFFQKYGSLFLVRPLRVFNKETKNWDNSNDAVDINFELDSPLKIHNLAKFLKEVQNVPIPSKSYMQLFIQKFITIQNFIPKSELLVLSIFQSIQDIINLHNLYLDRVSNSRLSKIVNNYTMKLMYDIILDPVNLIQAQTSVDGTTGPLKNETKKSNEGAEAKNRTPGNFTNKYLSIVENQVGKEAIAICATGLKAFFGLTQYNNYVLNYGTSEQLGRLLLGSDHRGHIIGGKLYKTLANIRTKDPNSIVNSDVLLALSEVNNDNDAALVLSALLSLATDNAKELALSKLNASTKTIGMYIYGITIGMDFRDIAKLLMSDAGGVITSLLEGDVFTGKEEYTKASQVFTYFEKCPNRILSKYDINGEEIGESPLEHFRNLFSNQESQLKDSKGNLLPLDIALATFASSNVLLSEKLNSIENLRNSYKSRSALAVEIYNLLIDFVEDYIRQCHIVSSNSLVLEDLQVLAKGADEMRRLGSIFSLNLGIKTDIEGLLRLVNLIERAIYDTTEDLEDIIDLVKFAFDEEYRKKMILKYEEIKHSFNILDAVSSVPHFLGYVLMLATSLMEARSSFKFRSTKTMSLELSRLIGYRDENRIIKGIQNYVGDYLRKLWMLLSDIKFTIPKGNKAFDKNGNQYELTLDTVVKLGTDWGDATFRMFVENLIIPDLKSGIIKPNILFPGISKNKFILDLGNDLLTNTVSKNPTIVYTLPINMLPRIDLERALLNLYKAEFNKLAQYGYLYLISSLNENGEEIKSLSLPYSIVDIFTYYAMIANSWKLSEKSLIPILEDFQNTGIIKNFHEFEALYDKFELPLSLSNTLYEELVPYVAPYQSPYSSYVQDIWYRNPNTRKVQLMHKMSRLEMEMEADLGDTYGRNPNIISKYRFSSESIDTNYFPVGLLEQSIRSVEHSYIDGDKTITFLVQYDIDSGYILKILVGADILLLKELKQVPIIKLNGIKKVDVNLLESIIKSKLNPC